MLFSGPRAQLALDALTPLRLHKPGIADEPSMRRIDFGSNTYTKRGGPRHCLHPLAGRTLTLSSCLCVRLSKPAGSPKLLSLRTTIKRRRGQCAAESRERWWPLFTDDRGLQLAQVVDRTGQLHPGQSGCRWGLLE